MPTEQELRQELVDLQQLINTDGWDRLFVYAAAMRQEDEVMIQDWIVNLLDTTNVGRAINRQGRGDGRAQLLDYVSARIAELEALLPPG